MNKSPRRILKNIILTGICGISLFTIHRQTSYFNQYKFECTEDKHNKFIINQLGDIDYKAPLHLPSCMMQMIYNEVKQTVNIDYKRELIDTHDGAVISLDWAPINHNSQCDKILIILHGLTGGSESSYIREIVDEYSKIEGFKVVAVNYRGINGTPLTTPSIYHAGFTEDIKTAIYYIKQNHPELRCYALGTSMGANVLAKLFANTREFDGYVKAFLSISNPFNCGEVEKRNRGRVLDKFLVRRQLKYLAKHEEVLKEKIGMVRNISI